MSYINFIKQLFTGDGSDNTPEGAIIRSGGKHTTNFITLNANNTSANVNVFQLTGTVNILALHGEIVTATTLTNCTSVYFDLWDGTNSTAITKTTGASLSGYAAGGFMIKDSDSATALSTVQNNQARVKEAGTGARLFNEFLCTQKASTNTYIRFNYTTTDAPINATIQVGIVYVDLDNGTVTAV